MAALFRNPNRSFVRKSVAPAASGPTPEELAEEVRRQAVDILKGYRANRLPWREVHRFFCLEHGVPSSLVDGIAHARAPLESLPKPLSQYL
jgi:hypothetical protein